MVVPTIAHYEVARLFLEAGKDVFIEKPITETTAQAEELVKLAQQRGRLVQVGHIERFNPVLSYLEKNLHEPKKRKATKPTRSSQRKRLDSKKTHSDIKKMRSEKIRY